MPVVTVTQEGEAVGSLEPRSLTQYGNAGGSCLKEEGGEWRKHSITESTAPGFCLVVPWKNKKTVSGPSNTVASLSQRVATSFVKITGAFPLLET